MGHPDPRSSSTVDVANRRLCEHQESGICCSIDICCVRADGVHAPLCSLDTGRLNAETYQLFDAVEKHYGIRIEYTFPDAQETMDLVRAKGMFSFYEDGHGECCRVRKV